MKNHCILLFCISLMAFEVWLAESHAMPLLRGERLDRRLRIKPTEAIVYPGENVTFLCYHPRNTTVKWTLSAEIDTYLVTNDKLEKDRAGIITGYYSTLSIFLATRRMSGEIKCETNQYDAKVVAFLIVNGVPNGRDCRTSNDCMTDKAICQDGVCECPRNYIRLRIKEKGYDICREMIYSLYDPCDVDEQCSHLVDPNAVCKSVCVCGPMSRDRRGKCITMHEISYARSQEMYRVGLIAVTCIIIIIVAVSLWVTLKRSCRESDRHHHHPSKRSVDLANDKPPAYDDILFTQNVIVEPPTIKDALKTCMTAKRLMRQVSAPAGQLMADLPKAKECLEKNGQ